VEERQEFYGVVTVGERGQVVIPVEARRQLSIKPGDKLLALGHPSGRALLLVRVEELMRFLRHIRYVLEAVEEETGPLGVDLSRESATPGASEGEEQ
jgi:AbrB family looped-hinge helix DNA binding protein